MVDLYYFTLHSTICLIVRLSFFFFWETTRGTIINQWHFRAAEFFFSFSRHHLIWIASRNGSSEAIRHGPVAWRQRGLDDTLNSSSFAITILLSFFWAWETVLFLSFFLFLRSLQMQMKWQLLTTLLLCLRIESHIKHMLDQYDDPVHFGIHTKTFLWMKVRFSKVRLHIKRKILHHRITNKGIIAGQPSRGSAEL